MPSIVETHVGQPLEMDIEAELAKELLDSMGGGGGEPAEARGPLTFLYNPTQRLEDQLLKAGSVITLSGGDTPPENVTLMVGDTLAWGSRRLTISEEGMVNINGQLIRPAPRAVSRFPTVADVRAMPDIPTSNNDYMDALNAMEKLATPIPEAARKQASQSWGPTADDIVELQADWPAAAKADPKDLAHLRELEAKGERNPLHWTDWSLMKTMAMKGTPSSEPMAMHVGASRMRKNAALYDSNKGGGHGGATYRIDPTTIYRGHNMRAGVDLTLPGGETVVLRNGDRLESKFGRFEVTDQGLMGLNGKLLQESDLIGPWNTNKAKEPPMSAETELSQISDELNRRMRATVATDTLSHFKTFQDPASAIDPLVEESRQRIEALTGSKQLLASETLARVATMDAVRTSKLDRLDQSINTHRSQIDEMMEAIAKLNREIEHLNGSKRDLILHVDNAKIKEQETGRTKSSQLDRLIAAETAKINSLLSKELDGGSKMSWEDAIIVSETPSITSDFDREVSEMVGTKKD